MIGFEISGERAVIERLDSFHPRLMQGLYERMERLTFDAAKRMNAADAWVVPGSDMMTGTIFREMDLTASKARFVPGRMRNPPRPAAKARGIPEVINPDKVLADLRRAVTEAIP